MKERIPFVWRSEDVDALVAAVDRSSPCAKQDCAILLLAATPAMWVIDIHDHLIRDQVRIEIGQAKGGEPLSLTLTKEIGYALIEYFLFGRKENTSDRSSGRSFVICA